ncbi:vacuolar sorting protein Vps60 [Schizosaccharomyces cryophilus OY26]|uniref:Vacuolar sorting protein Vps60 n=1 Tax=Schizosaccharomyces cryophilus (strain OY26 / ATCC MYA-4695 / CBS 11777 / NBRC 106824 / NRRL Y48691) TaxID=653667 RepID=S9VU82_SCHCR|nr:vacuolar sorting protein Vps60 [Schizosaccharomyces cryophilus OY26]EPY51338.1 vacuolar sorting protein Vps60 [Schizosaccharomyces cryophilus OY26]
MHRLFGRKPAAGTSPSLTDAIDSLDKRSDSLEVKISKLDSQLSVFQQKIANTRPGPGQTTLKQRAMGVLRQKKMYEAQLQQLQQQSFNMEQAAMTTESMKNTMTTVQTMQDTARQMKAQSKSLSIEKIEKLQDQIQDYMDTADEFNDVLGQNMANVDVDEEELDAELEALQQEASLNGDQITQDQPSYLQPSKEIPNFVDEEQLEAPNTAQ